MTPVPVPHDKQHTTRPQPHKQLLMGWIMGEMAATTMGGSNEGGGQQMMPHHQSETNDHSDDKQDNQGNEEAEDSNSNKVGKMDTSRKGEMAAHSANKNASKGGATSTANAARQDNQDRG